MTVTVRERAPAKVNIALAVTGRRDDGYHLLDTLVVFADMADDLTARDAEDITLRLSGRFAPAISDDADNLVLRAARLLAGLSGGGGAELGLRKALPVAAGLGGGSADAAAALRALSRLWSLDLSTGRLAEIGASLGADVPMCVHGRFLRARGVGEEIELLPDLPVLHLVLVNPGVGLPTPEVFAALDARDNPPLPPVPPLADFADVLGLVSATRNDLEPAAVKLRPIIGDVLEALRSIPFCRLVRMSGSGATCFGLFETREEAVTAAVSLAAVRRDWWVTACRAR